MTTVRQSLDLAVDVLTAAAWALAAFFAGARLTSMTGGILFALAVFVTAMTYVVSTRTQERRARNLAAGACPRCFLRESFDPAQDAPQDERTLIVEHKHRRWDASTQVWLAAVTSWRCPTCGFQHEEPLACERCPD